MNKILMILSFIFAIVLFGGAIGTYMGYLDSYLIAIIGGAGLSIVQYIQRVIARSRR